MAQVYSAWRENISYNAATQTPGESEVGVNVEQPNVTERHQHTPPPPRTPPVRLPFFQVAA